MRVRRDRNGNRDRNRIVFRLAWNDDDTRLIVLVIRWGDGRRLARWHIRGKSARDRRELDEGLHEVWGGTHDLGRLLVFFNDDGLASKDETLRGQVLSDV